MAGGGGAADRGGVAKVRMANSAAMRGADRLQACCRRFGGVTTDGNEAVFMVAGAFVLFDWED